MKTKPAPAIFCAVFACYAISSMAQADQTLSNLTSPTAINQHLLPGNNKKDIGSKSKSWRNIYFDSGLYIKGILAVHAMGTDNFFSGLKAGSASVTGSSNTGMGQEALNHLSSGANNTAVGYRSLYSVTSKSYNTAIGYYSLYSSTTGLFNTAGGAQSLYANTSGSYNTAGGYQSLYSNTTGFYNTAMGPQALYYNTNGSNNTAMGSHSLFYNSGGYSNTAVGAYSLPSNTTGYQNTAIGDSSLYSNTTGWHNNANGYRSLYSNTTGSSNNANGASSLYKNTSGFENTATGDGALYSNTTGNQNTAFGNSALSGNTTGYDNTAVGWGADVTAGDLVNTIAIGAGARVDASHKARIGDDLITSIGGHVGWSNFSDGRYKKDIKENIIGLSFINSLRPITYTINVKGLNEYYNKGRKQLIDDMSEDAKAERKKSEEAASKIVYNGFVAQEVEDAAKKLNYEFSGVDKPQSKDGIYGLRYGDFVVPLVKAVQELSKMNEEKDARINTQDKKIDDLQKQIDELKKIIGNQSSAITNKQVELSSPFGGVEGVLEQNIPNPFSSTTTISYTLPQKFANAQIVITDKNGKMLKQVNISGGGKGAVNIDAATLSSGAYHYSLYVDGKLISSKQMVFAK